MKNRMKKESKKTVLNLVHCDNAICVSIGNNDNRYYAKNISSRKLEKKVYNV